jgi:hypothetical protein
MMKTLALALLLLLPLAATAIEIRVHFPQVVGERTAFASDTILIVSGSEELGLDTQKVALTDTPRQPKNWNAFLEFDASIPVELPLALNGDWITVVYRFSAEHICEVKWFVYEGLRIDFLFFSDTQECEVENCNWGPEG